METFDYDSQYEIVKKDVVKAFTKALDIQAKDTGLRINVNSIWVDDKVDSGDFRSQLDATRKDKTWGAPVYASLELVDRNTGRRLSSVSKVKIATLPKATNLGSFIVDGRYYQVANQLRRKPGVYISQHKDLSVFTDINIARRPFQIEFSDKTQIFSMGQGQAKKPLYPILSRLGVSDSMLAKLWGEDVLEKNKAIKPREAVKAVKGAATWFTGQAFSSPDDATKAMGEFFETTELRGDVTQKTLGKSFTKVSPEVIARGSAELLKASNGERKIDDREALEFKKAFGYSDLIRERMIQPSGELASTLSEFRKRVGRRLNNTRKPPTEIGNLVNSNEFTPVFTTFFTKSELAGLTDQTNPLNMINGITKITLLGEGGVKSGHGVKEEERAVHPSHMGFIDPIHTPESDKIGLVMHLPIGVGKSGEDLLTRVYDVRKKKNRFISPSDARDLVVSFPDQFIDGQFVDKKVKALVGGELSLVESSKVDVVLGSAKQAFSVSSNSIPFLPSAHGVRGQMATKMLEQAISLVGREAPLVQEKVGRGTIEDEIGKGFSVQAVADGTVESISPNRIVLKTKDGLIEQPIQNNMPLNNKSFINADPRVKVGDVVKTGDLLADTNFTDKGILAIGTNLRAAYIPWKGYNFEDGIVITESAAKKLTSEHVHEYAASPEKGVVFSLRQFRVWKGGDLSVDQENKLDEDGVVKKGKILEKGDPIWVGTRDAKYDPESIMQARLGRMPPKKAHMESWDQDIAGEVVDVIKSGKKVKVFIKTREPAVIGDKLTNRHGGKGIVTKIIPDGESPHTEDGTPIDILLNPHGIITRMNPSQMLETAAAKIAEKTGKPYVVNNFSGENHIETVMAGLEKNGLKDTELLFDPHDTKPLGEVMVGPQYFLKLTKQAVSQFSARSTGKYDMNRAPLHGGDEGGKALDLLTFYGMLAHGAKANIREMATYKASENDAFWNWLAAGNKTGQIKPLPEPTFAYRKFEAYLKGAGVNVTRNGSKMVLGPMTDIGVDKLSSGEVVDPKFKKAKNLKDEKGGLTDPAIFGSEQNKWGHFALAEPIPNPMFEGPIKTLLGLKNAQFDSLISGTRFVNPDTGEWSDQGDQGNLTAGMAVRELLSRIDVDQQIQQWTDKAKGSTGVKGLDDANKHLKYLHALKRLGVRPEDAYIQTKIPIIPTGFRPIVEFEDGTLSSPGLNTLYRDIGLVNNQLKWESGIDYMPDSIKAELRTDLYKGVKALAGLGSPIAKYPAKRMPKGIVEQVGGKPSKKGFYQYKVLRRQQDLVGRGAIIPEPKLGVDEVGLPEAMAWKIYEPFVTRRLVNTAGYKPNDAFKQITDQTPVARSMLEAEMRDRPVILNRAPNLHKFGVMAFNPILTDGNAVKIPPLIVKGYNADFDGDAMVVHVPVLADAVREAQGMVPSKHLYKPGTGAIMIKPQNEATLGLFMMSRHPEQWQQVLDLLPPEMQTKYQGGHTDAKTLDAMYSDLAAHDPKEYSKVIDKLKHFGDEAAYRAGFTVSMKDLMPNNPERAGIFADTKAALHKLDFSKPAQRAQAVDLIGKASTKLDTTLTKNLNEQDNNFNTMVSSGARGSMSQLKQIVSAPFMMPDHRGNDSPIPIMTSYAEGLPFSEYWHTMYGARAGVADKMMQTSKPGSFTKDIMATTTTNVIAQDDCGTTEGITLPLESSDVADRYIAHDIKIGSTVVAAAGTPVTSSLISRLREHKVDSIDVRSPLTCRHPKGTCIKCYGIAENGSPPAIGDNVGALDGQALTEPLTQMTLRTFHMGGLSGTRGIISGYAKIDKLFKMQKIKGDAATLAQMDGKIESVKETAGGTGHDVIVRPTNPSDAKKGKKDQTTHFIPKRLWIPGKIKTGGDLKAGDIMSDGIAEPDDFARLKGLLPAENYMVDQIQDAYHKQKIPIKRRTIETVIRSVGNTTKILDPGDSEFIYGDVAPYTVVRDYNAQKLGKKPIEDAMGHSLQEDIAGFKKGSVIDERIKIALDRLGKKSVEVGPRPIIDEPFLAGVKRIPILRKDWMSQMGYERIKEGLIEGGATLHESDLHGYAPIPAFAYGAEFGAPPFDKKKTGVY